MPGYKLVGDITYLRTGQGWLFLATVIDLNTRMVVIGYIEGYFNTRRPHSTINYRIPAQVMQEFFDRVDARNEQSDALDLAA